MLTEKTFVQAKPTSKALVFTATARTIIKNIIVCNNSASTATATVWVDVDGVNANDENLIIAAYPYPTKVTANKSLFVVLEIGGTITAEGTGATITISGAELL